VGGGALPAFFATYFPHLAIDAVELDACVVAAATRFMGLHVNQAAPCSLTTAVPQNAPTAGCEISSTSGVSPPRRGVNIHIGDAAQWLRAHHQRQEGDVRGAAPSHTHHKPTQCRPTPRGCSCASVLLQWRAHGLSTSRWD
jgi:hypothetical protein